MTTLEEKLDEIIKNIRRIADAVDPPMDDPPDQKMVRCRCVSIRGEPIANCPICKGAG